MQWTAADREHIMADCDLHDAARHRLREAASNILPSTLLSICKHRNAISHFLQGSEAFVKIQLDTVSRAGTPRGRSPICWITFRAQVACP
jgi:hypothetical protein